MLRSRALRASAEHCVSRRRDLDLIGETRSISVYRFAFAGDHQHEAQATAMTTAEKSSQRCVRLVLTHAVQSTRASISARPPRILRTLLRSNVASSGGALGMVFGRGAGQREAIGLPAGDAFKVIELLPSRATSTPALSCPAWRQQTDERVVYRVSVARRSPRLATISHGPRSPALYGRLSPRPFRGALAVARLSPPLPAAARKNGPAAS